MLARKSVKQSYKPSQEVISLMQDFTRMTNDCIRIGLANNVSSMKKLSLLSYKELKRYNIYSQYRLTASSKAAGILSARKKSIRRGFKTKDPYVKKPILVSCYGFKIVNDKLRIPLGDKKFEEIFLTKHTLENISDPSLKVNSFTLTEASLSLCVSKEVPEMEEIAGAIGIDRNLRNLTAGNEGLVRYYDMNKVVQIAETTRSIVRSFKRNDVRIRKAISLKYGMRRSERAKRLLHLISKDIVRNAKELNQAIVFEDIRNIRNLYRKGNWQGGNYRGRMNSWQFGEIKRQIEYKANWQGVPVIHLTKGETRGTSLQCVKCGERLQSPLKDNVQHNRQLWCEKCREWSDRDLVAVLNICRRGWLRFVQSKGIDMSDEAMKWNPTTTVIHRVDPMKLGQTRGENR